MPSNSTRARRRKQKRQGRTQKKQRDVQQVSEWDRIWSTWNTDMRKLQGTFVIQIHPKFPPVIVQVTRGEARSGEPDTHHVERTFQTRLGNGSTVCTTMHVTMSMMDTRIYDTLWQPGLSFGHSVDAAIEGGAPSRFVIDYDLMLVPRVCAAAQVRSRGRLVIDRGGIINTRAKVPVDTLWGQKLEFVTVAPKLPSVDGVAGPAYARLMMARAAMSWNGHASEGILDSIGCWCTRHTAWFDMYWVSHAVDRAPRNKKSNDIPTPG